MGAEVNHVFRPTTKPLAIGEVRSMTWQIPVYLGPGDEVSPLWNNRCRRYWEHQQELYGLVFGDFTIAIEPPDPRTGKPAFLTTWSVLLAVVPGERHKSMVSVQ